MHSRYIETYPLICLAAQYSERVYDNPRGSERDTHVHADWRTGAKAMRIKSVPMDEMDTIVFAIRGTATFMDWSVNLNTAPTAPTGFLVSIESSRKLHLSRLMNCRTTPAISAMQVSYRLRER